MGGSTALVISVLSSWEFSLALIIIGVAYTIFVGKPRAGVQRHPALPYLAGSGFVVCLVLLAGLAIYGEYELQLRKAYADEASGIPRDASPANPLTPTNQRPLYAETPRFLTPDQQRILIAEGARVRSKLGSVLVSFLQTDTESQQYAIALNATLGRAAIKEWTDCPSAR
ncbi:hypothetical protein L6654_41305 [Bradyrhizobium sp. WYCCWR 13023]|uniref:Uncharacterized protein n=1 Tax=Bradyrhizobium zhengyangense TaxID=2911009 RepID=A0A9X1RHW4_9BRAD|nr:hypothetical protein [Bradyrhizobium zhengyangense]MCG2633004.1 hypothetical protein [Bradyrhizobium zhengyangense]